MKNQSKFISTFKALFALVILVTLAFSCQPSVSSNATTLGPDQLAPDMAAIMAPFAPQTQKFTVSSSKPSTVVGKAGTKIHVQPQNLSMPDGSPVISKIEVQLIECTKKSELLGAGLQTVSNGKLLESGGSYFVDMQAAGQPLKIKPGKTVEVEFPHLAKKEMELFYGAKNAAGQMNWEETAITFQSQEPAAAPMDVKSPQELFSDSSASILGGDTIYQFISGQDTFSSSNQDDVWAYIDGNSDLVPTPSGNGAQVGPKKSKSNASNDAREARNQKSMKARRQNAETAAANQRALADANRQAQQQSLAMRAAGTAPSIPVNPTYLGVNLDRFGWYNCDRFSGQGNVVAVSVTIPQAEFAGIVYLVFQSSNSIIQLPYSAGNMITNTVDLPLNEKIDIFVVAGENKDGTIQFVKSSAKVELDQTLELQPIPTEKTLVKEAFAKI